jgi:hypothetical protein
MHEKDVAGGKIDDKVFGAPPDAGDGFAFQASRKIFRQRPAQIAAPNLDTRNPFALHRGCEAATHSFDFGKFRHR